MVCVRARRWIGREGCGMYVCMGGFFIVVVRYLKK